MDIFTTFFFPRKKKKHRPLTRPGKGLEFFISIKILFALCDRNKPRGHSALLTWWVIRYKRFSDKYTQNILFKGAAVYFVEFFEHIFFLDSVVMSDFHQKAPSVRIPSEILSFLSEITLFHQGFQEIYPFICQDSLRNLLSVRYREEISYLLSGFPQKSFFLSGFQRKLLFLRFQIQTYLFQQNFTKNYSSRLYLKPLSFHQIMRQTNISDFISKVPYLCYILPQNDLVSIRFASEHLVQVRF